MAATARIVAVTTVTSIGLGMVTVSLVALASEPPGTIRHVLGDPVRAVNLMAIGMMASLPISIPAGLGGGLLAARIAANQTVRWSRRRWARRGAILGAAVGAGLTAALVALPQIGTADFALLAALAACTGGPTGGTAGAIVGWYCGRTVRVADGRRT